MIGAVLLAVLMQSAVPNKPAVTADRNNADGPLKNGCFWVRLHASNEGPKEACLGDPQGEQMIRLYLEQESYVNSRAAVRVVHPKP